MHSTNYIIRFVLIMTTVAALILAALNTFLAEKHVSNEKLYNKRAILSAVSAHIGGDTPLADLSDKQIEDLFQNNIQQVVIDMQGKTKEGMKAEAVDMAVEKKKPEADRLLPVYVFTNEEGKSYYILSIRGSGLWDEIWGSIALEGDLKTIAGASFDHKGETPGLGAEIKDNPAFPAQFMGKSIYDADGTYTSVSVVKGDAGDSPHQVDGISGATVTCSGVTEMLVRGLKYYEPYLTSIKNKS